MLKRQRTVASNAWRWLLHNNNQASAVTPFKSQSKITKRTWSAAMLTFLFIAAVFVWTNQRNASSAHPVSRSSSIADKVNTPTPSSTSPLQDTSPPAEEPIDTQGQVDSSTPTTTNSSPTTTVTVNGNTTTVPSNSSYQRTISDNNQTTTIKVHNDGSTTTSDSSMTTTGSSSSNSTVTLHMDSHSP